MKTRTLLVVFAAVSAVSSQAAMDLGHATQFNAFIFNQANTAGGHGQGAVAVGGNWIGSGYDVLQSNVPATVGSDNKIGMYVGGFVNFTNGGSINNGGNARVKGNFHSQNSFNVNGGTLYVGGTRTGGIGGSWQQNNDTVDASVFTNQKAFSLAQTSAIAALGGEAINTSDLNNWNINAANQAGAVKVYTINASSLNNLRTLNINGLTGTDTVLINVTGGDVNGFGITVNTNTGSFNKLLWNYGGSNFTINQRALHGSLLAPNATINQFQNIDGTLIANNWNNFNSVQLHSHTFTGTAVPEPGTMAVIGLGVAALVRRRRKNS